MKEAAGEANMTVITIILIGVIVAIAIPLVTSLMRNTTRRTCCTDAGGVWKASKCEHGTATGATQIFSSSAYKACCTDAGLADTLCK